MNYSLKLIMSYLPSYLIKISSYVIDNLTFKSIFEKNNKYL